MAVELVGRKEELAAVREALAQAGVGAAATLIQGEAGIGKTTLWLAGVAGAEEEGFRVLVSRPAEAETQLVYAGLTDLLDPVLAEVVDELPSPQRHALEVALLRGDADGSPPDQAAIGFGFLNALRTLAHQKPVLIAVDDVQWLDAPSEFVLRFAARRLREENVMLLLAGRTEQPGTTAFDLGSGLPQERIRRIEVGPLSLGALHHLVRQRLDVVLARPTLQRVHEASGGNPFFALELARALHERALEVEPGQPLPISGELRELLRNRLAGLADEVEEALLFVAAASQATVGLLSAALGEEVRPHLARAVDADLVDLEGERIRFVHPLLASAVYSALGTDRKRAAHRRLAEVVADPEERARHLALSSEEPDADVAAALDDAARIAHSRGAPQAAAELSEQALRLTPSDEAEAAHRRRLAAGSARFEAGDTARAQELFTEAADLAAAGPRRIEAVSRLARLYHYAGDQRVAVRLFRECLADEAADRALRADAAEGLAISLFFLREDLADALRHARSGTQLAADAGDNARHAIALGSQGVIEAVLGRPEAVDTLEAAVRLEQWSGDAPVVRQPGFQRALVRFWFDDLGGATAEIGAVRERALAQGDDSSLPFVLNYLSVSEFLSGRWEEAMSAADEGVDVALATGQGPGRAFALSARALVASGLGHEDDARSAARQALSLAELGAMLATMTSTWALGLLELSLDNPRAAQETLGPLVDRCEAAGIGEPGSMRFAPDEIEALVALGELESAVGRLEWYESCAGQVGRQSALAAAHRCRGLIAASEGNHDQALKELGLALEMLEPLSLPLERARTILSLGSAQRRANQRRDARETLGTALEKFEALGAALWADRTRAELRRISGRAPSPNQLTASERRVADLVAAGRTNREVAAALYVTPSTVEGTLSRVYSKLGIRSRTELARRWAAPSDS